MMRLDDQNRPIAEFNTPEYWREIAEGLWRAAKHFSKEVPHAAFGMRCIGKVCMDYSKVAEDRK